MATSKITSKRSILWTGDSNTKGTTITVDLSESIQKFNALAFIFSDAATDNNVIAECIIPVSALNEAASVGLRTAVFGSTAYYVQFNKDSDTRLRVVSGQTGTATTYYLHLRRIEGLN